MPFPSGDWWVYMIRCGDGTFYTGVSTDPGRRLEEHMRGRGARYTRGRGPLTIVFQAGPFDKGGALREERRVKRLSHRDKEAMSDVRGFPGGDGLHPVSDRDSHRQSC